MKSAIILIAIVAQAFGSGLFSDIIHDTKEAGHEVAHGVHDGVQTFTGGRSSTGDLMHHLDQGLNAAQGAKESVKNIASLKLRSGLIPEAIHHVKKGAQEAASGAHDAVTKFTGGRVGMMNQMSSSESSESREKGRIGACSLCAIEKASDKVTGAFSAIKDSISPSTKTRGFWNLGGLLGGESESLEHGTKVTKTTESKVMSPKARGLLDILGGSSSSSEPKVVKEVHNVAEDLHGNKLAEQSQKLQIEKGRYSSEEWVPMGQRLFGFGSGSSEETQKVVKDTKQVLDAQGRPIAFQDKLVEHHGRVLPSFARNPFLIAGRWSAEEPTKVVKDTQQAFDAQGRPIAFHDKLIEHHGRFLGFGESSNEEPKKIVKEVQQVLNAYGKPVSTTSKIIQKNRFLGLGSNDNEQKFVQQSQQLVDAYGRPYAAVTKFVEHNGRILGFGESSSESEPNQKVIKETHEILNDYGQKVGTFVKYHETLKQ